MSPYIERCLKGLKERNESLYRGCLKGLKESHHGQSHDIFFSQSTTPTPLSSPASC